MPNVLCVTVRFLDTTSAFHGRADGGEPEWPPSPLRLFQALVDAAASRWRALTFDDYAKPFLQWMEKLAPPTIISPAHHVGLPVRIAVPNNDLDVWAGPLSRGLEPKKQPNELKTMKAIRTTRLIPGGGDTVHYLYPITDAAEFAKHKQVLTDAARSVTHLGWGVDMVAGNAVEMTAENAAQFDGECWRPTAGGSGVQLRVPRAGTLEKLMEKHTAFLNRLSADGFKPVPPLTAFDTVGYRRDTDATARPVVAFELRTPDYERFQTYDPKRWTPAVAGMVRNAVAELARQTRPFGWTEKDINTFVHGHTADGNDRARGDAAGRRFSYLPLPSLERRPAGIHVGSIRRVLIAAPPECRDAVVWARVLSGQELSPLGDTLPAALRLIDRPEASLGNDPNLRPYVGNARTWSTVTPVVLPGYDDPDGIRKRLQETDPAKAMKADEKKGQLESLARRTRGLLEKAFRHAGFSEKVMSGLELEWRNVGFRAGVDLASRYCLPDRLNGPRYHVRVRFEHSVRGPLAVGAGRYRGLGLFATEEA